MWMPSSQDYQKRILELEAELKQVNHAYANLRASEEERLEEIERLQEAVLTHKEWNTIHSDTSSDFYTENQRLLNIEKAARNMTDGCRRMGIDEYAYIVACGFNILAEALGEVSDG